MAFYTGQYTASVDNKGRVAIPARFRAIATGQGSEKFVLKKGMDNCIELYSEHDWKEAEPRFIPPKPMAGKDQRFLSRFTYSNVEQVIPDGQGRVVIPRKLLEHAFIEREVLFLGAGEKVELWNEARYNQYLKDFGETPEQVVERLQNEKSG